jgi:hypothetical protein
VLGTWWVFWGVGTRLLVAGIAQVSGKGPTAEILGSSAPTVQETQLVHLPKRGKNAQETLATWTDLLVGVMVVVLEVYVLLRALAG